MYKQSNKMRSEDILDEWKKYRDINAKYDKVNQKGIVCEEDLMKIREMNLMTRLRIK